MLNTDAAIIFGLAARLDERLLLQSCVPNRLLVSQTKDTDMLLGTTGFGSVRTLEEYPMQECSFECQQHPFLRKPSFRSSENIIVFQDVTDRHVYIRRQSSLQITTKVRFPRFALAQSARRAVSNSIESSLRITQRMKNRTKKTRTTCLSVDAQRAHRGCSQSSRSKSRTRPAEQEQARAVSIVLQVFRQSGPRDVLSVQKLQRRRQIMGDG